jgi:hypothetical protein
MGLAKLLVIAFANNLVVMHQHRAYHRVRRYTAFTQLRQVQAAPHVLFVLFQIRLQNRGNAAKVGVSVLCFAASCRHGDLKK